ncbi:glycosyltransferase family 4 protein [Allohahella marinimesophila]|uniref:Glycosyl transferase family 1 domain-containing protein n=1 Tax=Allohahella marinimesophila TaxID=1054972 RepID=A0ABP7NME1_9GAMM
MIRLVVPGSVNQLTGGYRYDAALLKALQWSGVDAEAIEVLNLEEPDELRALVRDLQSDTPGPCHLIVDGLALARLHQHHAELLQQFSRVASHTHSLSALVHHPLCDETGLDDKQQVSLQTLEAAALQQVDLIITTSSHTCERIKCLFEPQQTVVAIEPGVERPKTLLKKQHRQGAEPLKLLCVASLVPRKGQDILVRALHRLSSQDVHCTLVGLLDRDPEFVTQIRQTVAELGLHSQVEMSGPLEEDALERHWQTADVLVLPSWYEGYGMVLDEAAVRGVPVLTTTGGALAATFREGTGLQVPPGDIEALAAAIARFAHDTALLSTCRTAALAISQAQRTWEEAAAETCLALEVMVPEARRLDLFDETWLALREPFDHQARSDNQAEQALRQWSQTLQTAGSALTVIDLGAGSGSNLRHLDACLRTQNDESLIGKRIAMDHDPAMLQALRQLPATEARAVDFQDLPSFAAAIHDAIPGGDASLLTGSALLDLVSDSWMTTVLELARQHNSAVFFALSVDGSSTLCPADEDDDLVQQLFNMHQRQGAGPGPDAAAMFARMARKRLFEVTVDASDWQLDSAAGASDRQLMTSLLTGWRVAAREQLAHAHLSASSSREARTGEQLIKVDAWCQRRMVQIRNGTLRLRLGHCDLLAIPGPAAVSAVI